jgi:hypothetical protein
MPRFEIDDRKLKRALQAQAPRTWQDDVRDLKMVGSLTAGPLLLVIAIGLAVYSLLSLL